MTPPVRAQIRYLPDSAALEVRIDRQTYVTRRPVTYTWVDGVLRVDTLWNGCIRTRIDELRVFSASHPVRVELKGDMKISNFFAYISVDYTDGTAGD